MYSEDSTLTGSSGTVQSLLDTWSPYAVHIHSDSNMRSFRFIKNEFVLLLYVQPPTTMCFSVNEKIVRIPIISIVLLGELELRTLHFKINLYNRP